MIQDILKNLGLPDLACRIYLQLLEKGTSSARQLAENLSIPRTSVYDYLKILLEKELVIEEEKENKKVFKLDDAENISRLLREQAENLQKQENEFRELLPNIKKQADYLEPKIKFYNGVEGLRRAMKDVLWHNDLETIGIWPMSEMLKVLGADFLNDFNKKRIRHNIKMRIIWPQDKIIDFKQFQFLGAGEKHLRDLRLAPKNISWNMGFWLYEDKVIFISSRQESFGFVIHSRDFSDLMKAQFEMIWPLCQKPKVDPKDTEKFLETI